MKVGIIGSGAISSIYLENMITKFENIDVIAIASKNIENAIEKAKKYDIKALTTEKLINNPEIELIVNLTPVGAHYELIKAALLAGKHVYTEKTLTDDLEKAKELVEIANKKGLLLCSAPDTFLGAAYQTARRAIDEGLIGDVSSFAISSNRDISFLISMFPFLREPGAGVLFDYAVYYMTALISILGPVSRVAGISENPNKIYKNPILESSEYDQDIVNINETRVTAILQMESGVSGTIHFDNNSILEDQAFFAVYGSKGILYLTDPNTFGGEVKFIPKTAEISDNTFGGDVKLSKKTKKNSDKAVPEVLWNFSCYSGNERGIGPSDLVNAIKDGTKPRASKELAFHVFEVLNAILKGGEKGAFFDIESTCERPEPLPLAHVPITNIAHTAFYMKNADEMLHFYADILGMERKFVINKKDDPTKPWLEYLRLADRQYIEFFYDLYGPKKMFDNKDGYYGYKKLNFEVDDIKKIKDILVKAGVEISKDIHRVVDGALEIVVHDPDGNEVQFTEYSKDGLIPLTEKENHKVYSHVKFTTQVAYNVEDAVNMRNFYTKGLNLKLVKTLKYSDLLDYLEKNGASLDETLHIKAIADERWIDFIEVAPHQYIELFYNYGEFKQVERDLFDYYGYQHLCLEVSDINECKAALLKNGLKLDKDITLAADNSYQLWVTDPDGNRIEIMQYTAESKQLQ